MLFFNSNLGYQVTSVRELVNYIFCIISIFVDCGLWNVNKWNVFIMIINILNNEKIRCNDWCSFMNDPIHQLYLSPSFIWKNPIILNFWMPLLFAFVNEGDSVYGYEQKIWT